MFKDERTDTCTFILPNRSFVCDVTREIVKSADDQHRQETKHMYFEQRDPVKTEVRCVDLQLRGKSARGPKKIWI